MPAMVTISKALVPMVDKYQTKRRFSTRGQAANELMRIALELEDLEVEEKKR